MKRLGVMKLLDKFILRITQNADEAWQDGYSAAMDEADETVADKDYFIAGQGEIIVRMMEVFDKAGVWDAVPSDLRETLRNYV